MPRRRHATQERFGCGLLDVGRSRIPAPAHVLGVRTVPSDSRYNEIVGIRNAVGPPRVTRGPRRRERGDHGNVWRHRTGLCGPLRVPVVIIGAGLHNRHGGGALRRLPAWVAPLRHATPSALHHWRHADADRRAVPGMVAGVAAVHQRHRRGGVPLRAERHRARGHGARRRRDGDGGHGNGRRPRSWKKRCPLRCRSPPPRCCPRAWLHRRRARTRLWACWRPPSPSETPPG